MRRLYKWEHNLEEMTGVLREYSGNSGLRDAMHTIIDLREKAENVARRMLSEKLIGERMAYASAVAKAKKLSIKGSKKEAAEAKKQAIQLKSEEMAKAKKIIEDVLNLQLTAAGENWSAIEPALNQIFEEIKHQKSPPLGKGFSIWNQFENFVEVIKAQELYVYKYGIPKGNKATNIIKRAFNVFEIGLVKILDFFSFKIDKMPDKFRQQMRASIAYYYCLTIFIGFFVLFLQARLSSGNNSLFWPDPKSFSSVSLLLALLALFALLLEKLRERILLRENEIPGFRDTTTFDKVAQAFEKLQDSAKENKVIANTLKIFQLRFLALLVGMTLLFLASLMFDIDFASYLSFIFSILFIFSSALIIMHPNKFLIDSYFFKLALLLVGGFLAYVIFNSGNYFTINIFNLQPISFDSSTFAITIMVVSLLNIILISVDTKKIYELGISPNRQLWILIAYSFITAGIGLVAAESIGNNLNLVSTLVLATIVILLFTFVSLLSFARLATVDFMRLFGASSFFFYVVMKIRDFIAVYALKADAVLNPAVEVYFLLPFLLSFLFGFVLFRREFVGSLSHLRFGMIIGQAVSNWQKEMQGKNSRTAIEMHEVFGAMTSRIGGGTGIGSTGLFSMQTLLFVNNGYIAYHAIAHDAAGHLLNKFGIGPGYQYAIPEIPYTRSIKNFNFMPPETEYYQPGFSYAITGQLSGFLLWADSMRKLEHDHILKITVENKKKRK